MTTRDEALAKAIRDAEGALRPALGLLLFGYLLDWPWAYWGGAAGVLVALLLLAIYRAMRSR